MTTPGIIPIHERSPEQIREDCQGRDRNCVDQLVKLAEYAASHNPPIGLKVLSHRMHIPQGTLSQLFSGSYNGDYEKQGQRVEQFFVELEKERVFGGVRTFVETQISKSLWTVFEKTRYSRRIQIIQSPEQLGKTRSAEEYARRNNGGRTIMVSLNDGGGANPFSLFIRDLAKQCGVHDLEGKKVITLRDNIDDFLELTSEIIIDEFHMIQYWPDKSVRALLDYIRRSLHANGRRGVVLISTNSDVYTLLQTFKQRTRYNLGQLLGRMCNQVLDLFPEEIPLDDVEALCGLYFKPRKATLQKLYDMATRPGLGHFGLLLDVLGRAWADCTVAGAAVTDEVVLTIAEDTMADLSRRKDMYK